MGALNLKITWNYLKRLKSRLKSRFSATICRFPVFFHYFFLFFFCFCGIHCIPSGFHWYCVVSRFHPCRATSPQTRDMSQAPLRDPSHSAHTHEIAWSNTLTSQLEIACKALTLSATHIILDAEWRWGYSVEMVKRYLLLEHAVKSTLPKVPVTSVDRALLVELVELLGTVTEESEGQEYVTLSQVFP